jgi:protein kinase-like protein
MNAVTRDSAVLDERARNAGWVLRVRLVLSLCGVLSVAPFQFRDQARALTPWLAANFILTLALFVAAWRSRRVLLRSFWAVPLVDIPTIFVVIFVGVRHGAQPAAAAAGGGSLSLVALLFVLFSLDLRTVIATAIAALALQLVSWWLIGRYTTNTPTIVIVVAGAATAAIYLTYRLRALLREKDDALSQVKRDLVRVTAEFQPGRLTGHTLDGKYLLEELLGRGGMGEVYRARDEAQRECAIKVLFAHLHESTGALERFRRESEIVAKLPRHLVAPVLAVGATGDGLHYLAMELLRGEDFGARLRRRVRISLGELVPIVERLGEALAAAHALGIVHRDLKPGNVFLVDNDADGPVRLLDFGISRMMETPSHVALTQTSMVLGTPGYLAPEQVAPRVGEVGPATDLFALGALCYRALTGENAFIANNPAQAAYAALNVMPPPPSKLQPQLSDDVDAVVLLALAKRLEDRYADARAFARDLRAASSGALDKAVRARAKRALQHDLALDKTV